MPDARYLMRRARKPINQINVVPYIDVMLVLLVIFMVTAPLVNPGVIDLPSVGKTSQPPPAPLEVIIRADQTLMLRERDKGRTDERPVTTAQLIALVHERQRTNADVPVVIAADRNVKYEAVLKVMDELQRGNVRRVGLLVKPTGT
jgi:biopolymer transport protein TolR